MPPSTTPDGALALAAAAALGAMAAMAALAWGRMRGAKSLFAIGLVAGFGFGLSSFLHHPEQIGWVGAIEPFRLQSLIIALLRDLPFQLLILTSLNAVATRFPGKRRASDLVAAGAGLGLGMGVAEGMSFLGQGGPWPVGVGFRVFFEPQAQVATSVLLAIGYAAWRGAAFARVKLAALATLVIAIHAVLGGACYELARVGHWLALLFPARLLTTAAVATALTAALALLVLWALARMPARAAAAAPGSPLSALDRLLLDARLWRTGGGAIALFAGGGLIACLGYVRTLDIHAALVAMLLTPPMCVGLGAVALARRLDGSPQPFARGPRAATRAPAEPAARDDQGARR